MDEAEFFEAFARRPEDPQLREVYADWLEERGDRWRADFVRLRLEVAPHLALGGWQPELAEYQRLYYFFDREWQRRVFDPPLRLEQRVDRRWLVAVLGGERERAAMGDHAPPSIVDQAVISPELFWGWPSAVLFRLAFAAARDAVEACAASPAMRDLPHRRVLAMIARVELAAGGGDASIDVDSLPRRERPANAIHRKIDSAYAEAVGLPNRLTLMLRPYQFVDRPRPHATFDVLVQAARVRENLGWSAKGYERRHRAMEQAVSLAQTSAVRAEKAARELAGAPPRLDHAGTRPDERARVLAELTRRRDHTRAVAATTKARADELVAACPPPPTFLTELRALLVRIAPGVIDWLQEQEEDFRTEVHKRSMVEEGPPNEWNQVCRTLYAEDGRTRFEYTTARR